MSAKRGLGRGLGALLGDAPPPTAPGGPAIRALPVSSIRPNPHQPRKHFDAAALEALRDSIAAFGVLVPVIVRPRDEGFELIAGERRWRASVAAKRETIPAIVREADDRESIEVAIVENLQRADLDPLEEAMGFAHLIDTYGFTQERVAERVGRSRPAVSNALRLLALPESVKLHVRSGQLSAGHARALLAVPAEERAALAESIVAKGLSVRAVERLAQRETSSRKAKNKGSSAGGASPQPADVEAVLERLRYRFGAPVALARRERGGGSIEIRFTDHDELIRLVDLLLGDA